MNPGTGVLDARCFRYDIENGARHGGWYTKCHPEETLLTEAALVTSLPTMASPGIGARQRPTPPFGKNICNWDRENPLYTEHFFKLTVKIRY
jgi:hypothetical protein